MDRSTAVLLDASDGEALWFLGTLAVIKVDGKQTGGRFALFEAWLPKHAAPPVHSHPQDETFIVLEGDVTVVIGGVSRRCKEGAIASAPGGTPHSFFVHSETARMLTLSTPAGIEDFVRSLSDPATERRIPDDDYPYPAKEKIDAAFAAAGIKVLGPPPELGD
jgi:quercetin dioxygenase-like cupin family protein